jgi:hypothetical protein
VNLYLASQTIGLGIKGIVIELNFMHSNDDIIAATQDPPIFKIAPRHEFLGESDWFSTFGKEAHDKIVSDMEIVATEAAPHECGVLVLIGGCFHCGICRV